MSIAQTLAAEVLARTIPPATAKEFLAQSDGTLSVAERAELLAAIAIVEGELKEEKPLLKELVPEGWLRDYMEYAQVSEAPDSFHLLCGVAALSHKIGRKLHYLLGSNVLYAPVSVFLVSPAGQARRSDALKTVMPVLHAARVAMLRDLMSPEGLLRWLDEQREGMVLADEAATLLSKRDYMGDMPKILCSLLDLPDSYGKTLKKAVDTVFIEKPTLSLLVGCAPSWIRDAMPKEALSGGLFSRLMIVYEQTRERVIPFPYEGASVGQIKAMQEKLGLTILKLTETLPPDVMMTFDPVAKKAYREFYHECKTLGDKADEKMAVYYSRKPTHVLRMLMTLLVSQGKTDGVVDMGTLQSGFAIVRALEDGLVQTYAEAGQEKHGQHRQIVLKALKSFGGKMVLHSRVSWKVGYAMDRRELEQVLLGLMESGQVVMHTQEKHGRVAKYYTLKGYEED